MARVLVTDGNERAALAVTRSLGLAGHHVIVTAERGRQSLAGCSRYAAGAESAPSSLVDPVGFVGVVSAIVGNGSIEVIIPITEASLRSLLPVRDRLAAVIPWPRLETFLLASDKARVLDVAQEVGVPIPRGVVLAAPEESRGPLIGLGFPLVIKPARSLGDRMAGGFSKHSVRFVPDERSLNAAIASFLPEAYPLLAQERIVGDGAGVFVLRAEGRRLATFAHRRIREKPPSGGVSVYSESVAPDPELVGYADRLLEALQWSGVAMVEFKRDRSTGRALLMEINARFWGSLQLAIDAGVDFPALLVRSALGEPVTPVTSYRIGARTRWWWGEIDHLVARVRRSPRALSLPDGTPGRWRVATDILCPWRSPGRNEVMRLDDLRPALRETVQWFGNLV